MITSDTDASLKWCSTPPLWHIDAVGRGVHPIINLRRCSVRPDTDRLCATAANGAMGQDQTRNGTLAALDRRVFGGCLAEAPFRRLRNGYALYRGGARIDAGWPGSFSLGPASLSLPLAR